RRAPQRGVRDHDQAARPPPERGGQSHHRRPVPEAGHHDSGRALRRDLSRGEGAVTDEASVMSRVALPEETQVERQLRPQRLDANGGQRAAVESLRVSVMAARQRSEPLDHVLLSGPPGLGKTTLATILANEMAASIVTTAGPSLERGGDLMGILTNLNER